MGDYYSGTSYMNWNATLRVIECNSYRNLDGDRDTKDYAAIANDDNKSPVFTSSDYAILRTIRRIRVFTTWKAGTTWEKFYDCKYSSVSDLDTSWTGVKFSGFSYTTVPTHLPSDDTEDYPFLRLAFFIS